MPEFDFITDYTPDRSLETIRTLGRLLDDLERVRIMNTNRIGALERSFGESLPHLVEIAQPIAQAEHLAELELVRTWRRHPLAPWASDVRGLGEKSVARLIAEIGDPSVGSTGHWEISENGAMPEADTQMADAPDYMKAITASDIQGTDASKARTWIVDAYYNRTVSQLWSYCGIGDPARSRIPKGAVQAELLCLDPETLVLTKGYQWVPIQELSVGTEIVGFDEEPLDPGKGFQRCLRVAQVTHLDRNVRDSFRFVTTDGIETIASAEHRWLVRTERGRTAWALTRDLKPGSKILKFGDPWSSSNGDHAFELGYLAGLFDGEGCLDKYGIAFYQNDGPVLERGIAALQELGFEPSVRKRKDETRQSLQVAVLGGLPEIMRFLCQVPTQRFRDISFWEGRQITKTRTASLSVVAEIEHIGSREMVGIETTSHTLIANGLFSHNSRGKPRAKKQMYLIATGLLKSGIRKKEPISYWGEMYMRMREKYADRIHDSACAPCHAKAGDPWKPGHQHMAALRKMEKELLKSMWREARRLRNLTYE